MVKPTKYRAKKQVVDGITFASRAEARRYGELKILQQAGEVSDLQMQVPFVLAPAVLIRGANRKSPALRYVADFVFVRDGARVIEDVKGALTQAYRDNTDSLSMATVRLHVYQCKRCEKPVYQIAGRKKCATGGWICPACVEKQKGK